MNLEEIPNSLLFMWELLLIIGFVIGLIMVHQILLIMVILGLLVILELVHIKYVLVGLDDGQKARIRPGIQESNGFTGHNEPVLFSNTLENIERCREEKSRT